MQYTLFTTVNRANGTDYDACQMQYPNRAECVKAMDAMIDASIRMSEAEADMPPSSIVFTVVLS